MDDDHKILPNMHVDRIERKLANNRFEPEPPDEAALTQEAAARLTQLLWDRCLDHHQINALAAAVWLVEKTISSDALSVRFTVEAFDFPYPVSTSIDANSCEVKAYPLPGEHDLTPRWYASPPEIIPLKKLQ